MMIGYSKWPAKLGWSLIWARIRGSRSSTTIAGAGRV
jgi:hypothetical protein